MLDHCVARIALFWNDNVSSVYRIAFAVERERGTKQRDFARKHAIHFVSKLIIFQNVESDTIKNLGRPRTDVYQSANSMSPQSNRILTLTNFENILIENIRKQH